MQTLLPPVNCPISALTAVVTLCLFGVTKVHKISSACGTMKWSATSVCVWKDDTCYDSLHFWRNKKQESLNYLSVEKWGIIAVIEDLFGVCHRSHLTASWPWTMKGMLSRQCQFYVLLIVPVDLSEVFVCQSICQSREMLIPYVVPFQKQYKSRRGYCWCSLVH